MPKNALTRAVVVLVALAVCEGLSILGTSIFPLGLLVLALVTTLLAARVGWTFGLVGGLVGLLAAETFLLRILPATRLDLAASHEIVWGAVAVALGLMLSFGRVSIPALSPSSARTGIRASIAAAAAGAAVIAIAVVSRLRVVSWSMKNDAAWTTFQAQHIAADHGINTAAHPNPSALMSALMAVADAPGRLTLTSAQWLRADITRNGELWIVIILATSVLLGVTASHSMALNHPRFRLIATVLISAFPFSWYVSGVAVDYGFYSASLAILLLVCVWITWLRWRTHPVWAFIFLALLSTDLLATWPPLVLLPASLAAVIFVRCARSFFTVSSPIRLAAWVLAVAQLAVYAVLVALPDLHANGKFLSAGGAIRNVPPALFVGIALASLLVTASLRVATGYGDALVGCAAIVIAMAVGVLALLVQGGAGWSYYPTKFAWLSTILLIAVMSCALAQLLSVARARRGLVIAGAVVSLGALTAAAGVVRPLGHGPLALSPLTSALQTSSRAEDVFAQRLFDLADPSHKTLLSRESSFPEDFYVDFWLLQLAAQTGDERIRYFAYSFDPTKASQVCQVVHAWHGHVRVLTSTPGWGAKIAAACPAADITTELVTRLN